MKQTIFIFLILGLIFVPNSNQTAFAQTKTIDTSAVFWTELQKLCGKSFAGTVAAAPAEDTTFKDKELVMHVRACEKNRIRIPFFVGGRPFADLGFEAQKRPHSAQTRPSPRRRNARQNNDVWRLDDKRGRDNQTDVSRRPANC